MSSTYLEEKVTRTDLGNGRYAYETTSYGVTMKSSKVLYTHVALFTGLDGTTEDGRPIITYHKSAAAAEKTRGYSSYWRKVAVVEIDAEARA